MSEKFMKWMIWGGFSAALLVAVFFSLFLLPATRVNPDIEYVLVLFVAGIIFNMVFRDVKLLYAAIALFAAASVFSVPKLIPVGMALMYLAPCLIIVLLLRRARMAI